MWLSIRRTNRRGVTRITSEPTDKADDAPATTTDRGTTTIPASLRRQVGIEAGDELRWTVENGDLFEVVRQREGVFADLDPVDAGETNALDVERELGSDGRVVGELAESRQ